MSEEKKEGKERKLSGYTISTIYAATILVLIIGVTTGSVIEFLYNFENKGIFFLILMLLGSFFMIKCLIKEIYYLGNGVPLMISNVEQGAIYNRIEDPAICMVQKDASKDEGKIYLLSNCPPRFSVAINGDGEYKIVTVPLPPMIQKE